MKCPSCPDVTLAITDRQGIEIDYCPTCRGVWLDRGELDKLIERAGSETPLRRSDRDRDHDERPAAEDRRRYRDDDDDDDDRYSGGGYGKRSRKKSLLSEIFDFG
ncbi:MAG: hypothetical protein FJW96_09845 [Actinobacteria bacterium]|nr:hypothetical protein [Actinomycetota bacterium]